MVLYIEKNFRVRHLNQKMRNNMKNALLLSALCIAFVACNRDDGCCPVQQCCPKPACPKPCCPRPVPCCPNGQPGNPQYYNDQSYNDGTHSEADWHITMNVKKAFMTDSDLSMSAKFVSVSTTNGTVSLTGTVSSKEESKKLERKAQSVPGVRSVDNQLMISQ